MGLGKEIGRTTDETKDLRQCWQTIRKDFLALNRLFHFTVDACANAYNAQCTKYWTKEMDCLKQDWSRERVFCNPPFGIIGKIVPKAKTARFCLFLLPLTCLTTKYFNQNKPELIAIPPRRIKFIPPPGLETNSNPSLGTVMLLYGKTTEAQVIGLQELGLNLYEGR